jgi:hypothetical protein
VYKTQYISHTSANELVLFCIPDDAQVVRSILSFIYKILSYFVKPPNDTVLGYFIMFHVVPSPSPVQFKLYFFINLVLIIYYKTDWFKGKCIHEFLFIIVLVFGGLIVFNSC